MDAPQHTRLRRLVAGAFTPRRMVLMDEAISRAARDIVARVAENSTVELVADIAERLPIWTICEIIGLPEHDRDQALRLSNIMTGCRDTGYHGYDDPAIALRESLVSFSAMTYELVDERRRYAADDLTSALIAAEVDGQRLTDDEIQAFLVLLFVAGNETTRHAISHGVLALSQFPEQRTLLMADLPGRISGAVEEILRWSTPIMTFRRTATRSVDLAGAHIDAGDAVIMFYSSANRDESVFRDPWQFDITRTPQPHIAFGGGGPHFCLGAHLARLELQHIFTEILCNLPDLSFGEPQLIAGNFTNGIGGLVGTAVPARIGPFSPAGIPG
jgi:cytochrome P450